MLKTLDEFEREFEREMQDERDMLLYSNWYTNFLHACEIAGLDPAKIENMKIPKRKRKRK